MALAPLILQIALSAGLVSSMMLHQQGLASGSLPTLYVVNPSYIGHLEQWTNLVASALTAENDGSGECGYGRTIFSTIVSDEDERTVFEKRLSSIQSSCSSTGPSRIDRIQIRTLAEVLRSTKALAESDDVLAVTPANKYVYQAAKKFYGCLDAAALSVNGSEPRPDDVCFLIDSDSRVLRNSFCHLASRYTSNKTVFISPYPDANHIYHDDTIEYSRKVLSLRPTTTEGLGANTFGEFFAMESYHWMFEVGLVQQFLQTISLASLARAWAETPKMLYLENPKYPENDDDARVYAEEMMYHFLYPKRQAWGYQYVDVYDLLKNVLGASTFAAMVQSFRPDKAVVESLSERLSTLTRDQALAIGTTLREHGVLQMRCSNIETENVQTVMQFLDLCNSLYTEGSVSPKMNARHTGEHAGGGSGANQHPSAAPPACRALVE